MATKQRSSQKRSAAKPRGGRRASEKDEKYRFAQNLNGEETAPEREYRAYAAAARDGDDDDPDVLLDVPVVKVDSLHLEVEDLYAQVALQAKVLELLELDVGVQAELGKVKIDIKGVEAQALLKVRLDHVAAIVDRVMTTLDRNPELIESIAHAVEETGSGTRQALGGTGEAAEDLGEGAGQAVDEVGEGAGQAVGEVGEGAGQAVEGAGEAAGGLVDTATGAIQGSGDAGGAAGGLTDTATQALGGGQQQGSGGGQAAQQGSDGQQRGSKESRGSQGGGDAVSKLAEEVGRVAAQALAQEIGSAAGRSVPESDEQAAARHNATEAAARVARELEVDLASLDGSGAEGRITVGDVRRHAKD